MQMCKDTNLSEHSKMVKITIICVFMSIPSKLRFLSKKIATYSFYYSHLSVLQHFFWKQPSFTAHNLIEITTWEKFLKMLIFTDVNSHESWQLTCLAKWPKKVHQHICNSFGLEKSNNSVCHNKRVYVNLRLIS